MKNIDLGHRILGWATGFRVPGGPMATGFQILISHTTSVEGASEILLTCLGAKIIGAILNKGHMLSRVTVTIIPRSMKICIS